ncbi:hypothetical protein AB7M70_011842 [Bradyrhizobium japonicum]
MARKRQLSNAFGQFEKSQEEKTTVITEELNNIPVTENNNILNNTESEQSNKRNNSVNKVIKEDVTSNSNTEDVTKDVILNEDQPEPPVSVAQVKEDLLSMYDEKAKKERVEDTHVRTTFLFRKDLSKRLEKLAKNKRGFKTLFMNKAIEALLDELERK